ncbi:MAG: SRPBCC domain-containing protein [Alphaproteobacteria bacterium]|nr:SRPBCC domain-containing protein [Alphaproteobacteria bacterium]MCW5743748.1 SRPBCC domain-containing protein [Alphaproteobacteria bacterium]
MSTLQTLTIDQPIKASPAQVWERISTPEGIESWWVPGDIAPVVDHHFTLDMGPSGQQQCRVIEVVTERKLAHTFGDWELHWRIAAVQGGSLLRLEHHGFDLDNPQHKFGFENMGDGWRLVILPKLARVLEAP